MLLAHLWWRLKALLDLNFADVQEMMQMRMSVCLKQALVCPIQGTLSGSEMFAICLILAIDYAAFKK